MAALSSVSEKKRRFRSLAMIQRVATCTPTSTLALEKVVKCRSCGYNDPPQIMHHSSVSSARRTQDRFCQQTAILGGGSDCLFGPAWSDSLDCRDLDGYRSSGRFSRDCRGP